MRLRLLIIVLGLVGLSTALRAQSSQPYDQNNSYQQYQDYLRWQEQQNNSSNSGAALKPHRKILTGFSGGMMVHIGYGFSKNPAELFANNTLLTSQFWKNLPTDGVMIGLGGALRLHLLEHIHLGGEGGVSTMPLGKSGSNVRSGYGGALIDFYTTFGRFSPMIGMTIGGGSMSRLYVGVDETSSTSDSTVYNASSTKSSFFLLDPYIGFEVASNSDRVHFIVRIDYMLPFGSTKGISAGETFKWSNFITPSGPRLYIGVMFNHTRR